MTKKERLIKELGKMPEPYVDEIYDFVQFLKTRIAGEKNEAALASESSLKKDWLRPEEDEAWKNL